MPSSNPRVNLTLNDAQYALLKRMAALQGRSMASIVVELLDTVSPVFERMCDAIEAVAKAPANMRAGLLKSFEEAEQAAFPFLMEAAGQVDKGLSVGKGKKSQAVQQTVQKLLPAKAPGGKVGTPGAAVPKARASDEHAGRGRGVRREDPGNRNDPGQVSTGSGRKTAPSSRKSATSKGKR